MTAPVDPIAARRRFAHYYHPPGPTYLCGLPWRTQTGIAPDDLERCVVCRDLIGEAAEVVEQSATTP